MKVMTDGIVPSQIRERQAAFMDPPFSNGVSYISYVTPHKILHRESVTEPGSGEGGPSHFT